MAEEKTLPEMFHFAVETSIDERGVYPHQAFVKRADGEIEMMALDLDPGQVFRLVASKSREPDLDELIYGLDRFTKPGQGTELADCVAGAWFKKGVGWKPFVIEYRHEPRAIRPISWTNAHWQSVIGRELGQLGITDLVRVQ